MVETTSTACVPAGPSTKNIVFQKAKSWLYIFKEVEQWKVSEETPK